MHIYVFHPGHSKAERIRAAFSRSLSPYYIGWDDEFDRQFAGQTLCFALGEHPNKKPHATCRLISKKYGAAVGPLPMEKGDKSACVPRRAGRVVEGSGFCWSEPIYGIDLLHGVMRWLLKYEVHRGYVLFDALNETIKRLYVHTLGLLCLPGERVIYSSFKRRKNDKPVEWHVATGDQPIFRAALQRLERAGARRFQVRETHMLGGWTIADAVADKRDQLGARVDPQGPVGQLRVLPHRPFGQGEPVRDLLVREP